MVSKTAAKKLDDLLITPPIKNMNTHYILGEIIDHIHHLEEDFPHLDYPKLKQQLWEVRNKIVNPQTHLQGFLQAFQETPTFKNAFEELDETTKFRVKNFIKHGNEESVILKGNTFNLPPSPPVKHHFQELMQKFEHLFHPEKETNGHASGAPTHGHTNDVNGAAATNGHTEKGIVLNKDDPQIFEDKAETKPMEVYENKKFENWSQSIINIPRWTFIPKTVLGLQNLVKWAKVNDFRVRCGGYRHSWSSTFSQDKQILVSLLNLEEVTKIPDPMSIEEEYIDPNNELKVIQFSSLPGLVASSADKALVRVGVSVTNEQFRRWAVKNDKWTLPVDVILVEVTIGGVNGPICHGAGIGHGTVNDYVRAVEFVNANGDHRTISDPAQLKAAAGHFGLMGVVTHITFEVDSMSYAILQPFKPDIALAIPPLDPEDVPLALRKTHTQAQLDAALVDFKDRAANSYYAEWFWFTRSEQAWVNTWNTTKDKTGVVEYPSTFDTFLQWIEGWLGGVITTSPIFDAFPGRWQAVILGTLGMLNLPPFQFANFQQSASQAPQIKCALPNAMHFRRGIQNMRVRDMEFQIPIPSMADDDSKPDWSIVQQAWWDIIKLCYKNDDCPMRLTLEMRIMGGSELIMAPQRGNKHGTASIEVLSVPDVVSDKEWAPFLQNVANLWLSYKDSHGANLNVRPHWAKEWEHVHMHEIPARKYLKEVAYKDAIPEFKAVLAEIGQQQGWSLEDLQKRFSNELWDYMIYE